MRKEIYLSLILTLAAMLLIGCKQNSSAIISDLKCENLYNPNGIDTTTPHFSWKATHAKGVFEQEYYEIQVASDSLSLVNGNADLWNADKIKSSESVLIPYAGSELHSRQLCYWRVRIWDNKGEASEWSNIARFGIGIVGSDSMQGSYIGVSSDAKNIQSPLLRKEFTIKEKGISFLHVNSLGYHEVHINGQKVSEDVLSPAVSQLNKRSLIVTYDVTSYLLEGKNEIVLWTAKGWYRKNTFNAVYDGPLVKAQLDVLENNKWSTVLTTDSSWTGRHGGYTETGAWEALRFAGEYADGRLIPRDLKTTTLNEMTWYPVVEVTVPEHLASPEMVEPNRKQETITPDKITPLGKGAWLVDMGKALNGWFELRLPKLSEGEEVLIEYTDYLDKEGNFLDQGQSDIYIAVGDGGDVFCNKFINHAFQYAKISNLKSEPQKDDIRAYLIHSNYSRASSFECSDPDLNAIHNMIQYTMQCLSYSGYMVDCPHLERAGYGGDGNSSAETLQTMYDMSPLFNNWMQAWSDVMREGGSLPHVAPNPGAGGGGPYWCGFIIMGSWQTYLNYNDSRLLERYYPAMKKWLEYVDKYTVDGLLQRWADTEYRDWFLGDWLAPDGVDVFSEASITLVNNSFISDCFATMEKIANVLGKMDDAKKYAQQKTDLNTLLHSTFYDEKKHTYATASQLDMAYPMLVGVTPSSSYADVEKQLLSVTEDKYNGHIACGLVGVSVLTKWAVKNRAVDLIYKMLKKRDYPGYLYMIDNGASTTWEYWNGERSRIHNCYNGIGSWFYQAIGGIRTDENEPGYKHVYIDPQLPEGVTWAKTIKESPYGTISVDWKLENNTLSMNVEIPVGSRASIVLPKGILKYELNGNSFAKETEIVAVKNGAYTLTVPLAD